jgi:LemA protein
MPELLILAVVFFIPLLWAIVQYNTLISLKNQISEAWSNVDTELKRRYDLIPNLVSTVKGYAAHEKETLERVVELRNRCFDNHGTVSEQERDENQLVEALKHMFMIVENYPQLKADQHFLKLQGELTNTEDRIQAARRFYNGNVTTGINASRFLATSSLERSGSNRLSFSVCHRWWERLRR